MKYKVGDKVSLVVEIIDTDEDDPSWGYRCMLPNSVGTWMRERDLEAAAYAAKAAPAPVSTAWEPKRDEVVLVEMEFVREKADGEVYVQKGDGNFIAVPRSAIVGPAPKRARFANGDTAFCISTMTRVTVYDNVGKNQWRTTNGDNMVWLTDDADLLTLDEARERLGKK